MLFITVFVILGGGNGWGHTAVFAAPAAPTAYDCAAQADIPQSQCEALVAIHTANPTSSFGASWLVDGSSPCSWNDVTCEANTVTQLNLDIKRLTTIPTEIGNLSGLQHLNLSNNQLATVPVEIGNLASLTNLTLSRNRLTVLPTEIGNLSNLKTFNLYSNRLTALPTEIGNLSNLQSLNLSNNRLTSVPTEIGNLSNLKTLSLFDNQLTSIPTEIGNLSNLESLRLSRNRLTGLPTEIGSLSNLIDLYISVNQLTALPAEIGNLSNLRFLVAPGNQLTAVPKEIGQLSLLESLRLNANQLTAVPKEIGSLSNLKSLRLDSNRLLTVPSEIGNLSNLEYFDLSRNQLTNLPAEIGNLSNLQSLRLSRNRLTALPKEIGNLSNVQDIYLNENRLTSLPATIGNLPNLQELNLSSNYLMTIPSEIDNLSNLTTLIINDNLLASLPAEIGSLSSLVELDLSENQLATLPTEIGDLSNLTQLYLNTNKLTAVPAEMGNLSSLEALILEDNPLTGPVPGFLTALSLYSFWFKDTDWCVTTGSPVQTWLLGIDEMVSTGYICGQPAAALTGRVTLSSTLPLTETTITLYRQTTVYSRGSFVATTYPDSEGNYSFSNLGDGIGYFVHFAPPVNSGLMPQYYDAQRLLREATPITPTAGITTTDINATFVPAPVQPPTITVTSTHGTVIYNSILDSFHVGQTSENKSDVHVTATLLCADDSVPMAVKVYLRRTSYSITATSNPNEYRVVIPAETVASGRLRYVLECAGGNEYKTFGSMTIYDPLGVVTDVSTGEPVAGATVTLYQVPGWKLKKDDTDTRPNTCQSNASKAAGKVWNQPAPTDLGWLVNPDSIGMRPDINQLQTDKAGHYGWILLSQRCWYVTVTAEGYQPLTSPVVGIDRDVNDLDLQLTPIAGDIYLPLITR